MAEIWYILGLMSSFPIKYTVRTKKKILSKTKKS